MITRIGNRREVGCAATGYGTSQHYCWGNREKWKTFPKVSESPVVCLAKWKGTTRDLEEGEGREIRVPRTNEHLHHSMQNRRAQWEWEWEECLWRANRAKKTKDGRTESASGRRRVGRSSLGANEQDDTEGPLMSWDMMCARRREGPVHCDWKWKTQRTCKLNAPDENIERSRSAAASLVPRNSLGTRCLQFSVVVCLFFVFSAVGNHPEIMTSLFASSCSIGSYCCQKDLLKHHWTQEEARWTRRRRRWCRTRFWMRWRGERTFRKGRSNVQFARQNISAAGRLERKRRLQMQMTREGRRSMMFGFTAKPMCSKDCSQKMSELDQCAC